MQCQFGLLKVAHSCVSVDNVTTGEESEVGVNCCQSGYVKTRQFKPNPYFKKKPKKHHRGI